MSLYLNKNPVQGFTLIEALVSITIILLALGAPLTAMNHSYVAASDAKNYLTASYLAQEAIEYVRMLRDTTYLVDSDAGVSDLSDTAFRVHFLESSSASVPSSVFECQGNTGSFPDGGDGSVACALDTSLALGIDDSTGTTKALRVCATVDTCSPLYLTSSGQYTLDSAAGIETNFVRKIQFYQFGYGSTQQGVEVVVTVSWAFHDQPRSITIRSYFMPWQ